MSTSFWLHFFESAGIPNADALDYAAAFTENDMQRFMLLDLTKDLLVDMLHVKKAGHIIAILKHAKTVAAQESRAKTLRGSDLAPEQSPKKSTPASRTMMHYLRKAESPRPTDVAQKAITDERLLKVRVPGAAAACESIFSRLGKQTSDSEPTTVTSAPKTKPIISTYTISDEGTVQISQQPAVQPSVFGRLGGKTGTAPTLKRLAGAVSSMQGPESPPLDYQGVLDSSRTAEPLKKKGRLTVTVGVGKGSVTSGAAQGVPKKKFISQKTAPDAIAPTTGKQTALAHGSVPAMANTTVSQIHSRLGPAPKSSAVTNAQTRLTTVVVRNDIPDSSTGTKVRNQLSSSSKPSQAPVLKTALPVVPLHALRSSPPLAAATTTGHGKMVETAGILSRFAHTDKVTVKDRIGTKQKSGPSSSGGGAVGGPPLSCSVVSSTTPSRGAAKRGAKQRIGRAEAGVKARLGK